MSTQPSRESLVFPSPAARRAMLLGNAIGLGQAPALSDTRDDHHVPVVLIALAALFVIAMLVAV